VMQAEERLRADLVEVGRRIYERGFVASNDGNMSVRLEGDRLLTTPTGVSKGFMTPDMMVITDITGRKLTGNLEPSSEILMHVAVYENRPEITAVVHAHPPTATGFAVAGIPLDRAVLAEVVTTLGSIPIADYGTPSTSELADAVRYHIRAHDGLLLANHGALTVANGLFPAYYKMETVEHFARISLVARQLGGERLLSREEVTRLQSLRDRYGITAPAPICSPDEDPDDEAVNCQTLDAPSQSGARLVDFRSVSPGVGVAPSPDDEIRLTYSELTALITEAVRQLR
jgi:L-fuculose-phosphate aldolase